jgi:hypothetical protein
MPSRLPSRVVIHDEATQAMLGQAMEHKDSVASSFFIAASIHSLAITLAECFIPDSDPMSDEEFVVATKNFEEALEAHEESIQKALRGESPWQEILSAAERLKEAGARLKVAR